MSLISGPIALLYLVPVVWQAVLLSPLERSGYHHILKPNRQELDLLDPIAVDNWFLVHNPSVAVLAAAKVGGIYANSTYPADFLLENSRSKRM